ncbi:MAG: hypothetical protein H7839_09145 [Magnetococcus sp. YQC-5]
MLTGTKWVALLAMLCLTGCASDNTKPQTATTATATTAQKKPESGAALAAASPQTNPSTTQASASVAKHDNLVGSKRKDLIEKLGQPNMTMDVTLAGRPPSEGYLYYPKQGTGCVHTYVVTEESGDVIDYFCR